MLPGTPLELTLLGGLEARVRTPEGVRTLGRGKPTALLAFLALAPGRRASREQLATLLWSDGSSEAARQNLRQTLWYLRRRLGDVVVATDDFVSLAPDARSDAADFLAAVESNRLAEAIDLFPGNLIPEFAAPGASPFEEWADLERRRIRAMFVASVESHARALLSSGRATEAARLARRGREIAPTDPIVWRVLIESLLSSRDALAAAAEVAQLEAAIEHGDIAMDASTQSLVRLARRLAEGKETEASGSADEAPSYAPDLIGREREFRVLVDAWESARRGQGGTIVLSGAAGLGKTRLLNDFGARVEGARGRVVQLRAHPGNRTIEASFVADLAERLAALPGALAVAPASASVLVALTPRLHEIYRVAVADTAAGEDATRRRVSALEDLLRAVCDSAPICLLLDDIHWADPLSVRILGALRSRAVATRVLAVLSMRVPDDFHLVAGVTDDLPLKPLDVAGVGEFVSRLATIPSEGWGASFVPRLHQTTGGIPLHVIETLQRLVESGMLDRRDGAWRTPDPLRLSTALPEGGALRSRLGSLSPTSRRVLLRLATIGRPVELSQLTADDEVPDWLQEFNDLERRGFAVRSATRVAVWHDEVGAGILDASSPDDRAGAHAWVVRNLLRFGVERSDLTLAVWHAVRAADERLVSQTWAAVLRDRRRHGDLRSARVIGDEALGTLLPTGAIARVVAGVSVTERIDRRVLRAVAAVGVVGLALTAWGALPTAAPDVELLLESASGREWFSVTFERGVPWDPAAPLRATPVRGSRLPAVPDQEHEWLGPLLADSGWLGVRAFTDSGGQEIVVADRSGLVSRIASAPGDDFSPSPSPDGTRIVFATRRFDRRDHVANLVIWDDRAGGLSRLTHGLDDDESPLWRPDGTLIAFRRRYNNDQRPSEACVIAVDGAEERCFRSSGEVDVHIVAWIDAERLLLRDDQNALSRLDVRTGETQPVGSAEGALVAVSTDILLCRCLERGGRGAVASLSLISNPLSAREIQVDGQVVAPRRALPLRAGREPRYLDTLRFESSDIRIRLDGAGAVRMSGVDQHGASISVRDPRLIARDTTVVRVERDGTLRPRRLGRAWVVVSAGGWRTDSLQVEVIEAGSRTRISESWERGIRTPWREFGDPRPIVVQTAEGPALATNGDGIYPSGLYLNERIEGREGVGVELLVQLPFFAPKQQTFAISLLGWSAEDSLELARWDHRTLAPRMRRERGCDTSFPYGEGGLAYSRIYVGAGDQAERRAFAQVPPGFYGQAWNRIRLQFFPDGRCGLAINGVPVAITPHAGESVDRFTLYLLGSAVGARGLVREVEVWEGVRGDVRWEALSGGRK